MKLEDLHRPQLVELDLRLPLFGGAAGLVLLAGWLLLGQAGGSGELLPLPETPAGAAPAAVTGTQAAGGRAEAPHQLVQTQPARPVHNPFGSPQLLPKPPAVPGTPLPAVRDGRALPAPAAPELRLSGIISAGDSRLALLSRGGYDLCLGQGSTGEGLTVLFIGEDFVVVRDTAGERILRLAHAAGGGSNSEPKAEARPAVRHDDSRTGSGKRKR